MILQETLKSEMIFGIGETVMERATRMLVEAVEQAMKNPPPLDEEKESRIFSTTIKFRPIECKDMAQPFKHVFINRGRIARLIKYANGNYEIRYRRYGFNVSVLSDDLATAKQLFIAKVSE